MNVPSGDVLRRYSFPEGASIAAGATWTFCNSQASSYLLEEVCDETGSLGINGNDAVTLVSGDRSPLVCYLKKMLKNK